MPKLRKGSFISFCLRVFLWLVCLEAIAGVLIYAAHVRYDRPRNINDFAFHPLLTGKDISRHRDIWNEYHPVYGYINRLNVSDECGYSTDRYGFIHNGDSQRELKKSDFKIFILGGSSVAGHGVSCNDKTISAQLEQLARQKYDHIQVINAGVPGHYSASEFMKMTNEIAFFNPDLVITLAGDNDEGKATESFMGRPHGYFVNPYHRYLKNFMDENNGFIWSARHFVYSIFCFAERTYLYFTAKSALLILTNKFHFQKGLINNTIEIYGKPNGPDPVTAKEDNQFMEAYDQNVNYFLRYTQMTQSAVMSLGAKYVFFLQPRLAVEKRRLTPNQREALDIAQRAVMDRNGHDYVKRAKYFWEKTASVFQANGIHFVDLSNIFPDDTETYYDPIHYNDLGNRIIAERLFSFIEENKYIPQSLAKQR